MKKSTGAIVTLSMFLIAFVSSMAGYIFDIVVLAIYNRKKCLLKGITRVERAFTNDMLHFSVPLIFFWNIVVGRVILGSLFCIVDVRFGCKWSICRCI